MRTQKSKRFFFYYIWAKQNSSFFTNIWDKWGIRMKKFMADICVFIAIFVTCFFFSQNVLSLKLEKLASIEIAINTHTS